MDVTEHGIRRLLVRHDRNRPAKNVNAAAHEIWVARRLPKLLVPEVHDTTPPIRKLSGSGSLKEGPNVEVFHPSCVIEIVEGGTLAKSEAKEPILAHLANMRLSQIKVFQVVECQWHKATKVALGY
jgi:hypothetical protein